MTHCAEQPLFHICLNMQSLLNLILLLLLHFSRIKFFGHVIVKSRKYFQYFWHKSPNKWTFFSTIFLPLCFLTFLGVRSSPVARSAEVGQISISSWCWDPEFKKTDILSQSWYFESSWYFKQKLVFLTKLIFLPSRSWSDQHQLLMLRSGV